MWGLELLPDVQQVLGVAAVKLAIPWAAIAMMLGMDANAWSSSRRSNREDEREDAQRAYEHQLGLYRRRSQDEILRGGWGRYAPNIPEPDWAARADIPAPPPTPGRGFDWQGLVGGLASGAGMGLAAEGAGQPQIPDWLSNLSPEMQRWLRSMADDRPEGYV